MDTTTASGLSFSACVVSGTVIVKIGGDEDDDGIASSWSPSKAALSAAQCWENSHLNDDAICSRP